MLNTDFIPNFKELLSSKGDKVIYDKILDSPAYRELFSREYCLSKSRMKYIFDLCIGEKSRYLQAIKSHYKTKQDIKYRFYEYLIKSVQTVTKRISDIEKHINSIDLIRLEMDVKQRLSEFIDFDDNDILPEVYFVISPGYFGYEPIIMDLSFLVDEETGEMINYNNLVNTIAHECFHVIRARELKKSGLVKTGFKSWLMDQIVNEGIADCIDILPRYSEDSEFIKGHKEQQKQQPEVLKRLNLIFFATGENEFTSDQISKIRKLVPDAGHALGFYIIQKMLGRNKEMNIKDLVYDMDLQSVLLSI